MCMLRKWSLRLSSRKWSLQRLQYPLIKEYTFTLIKGYRSLWVSRHPKPCYFPGSLDSDDAELVVPPPVNVPPMLENNATQHDALFAAQIHVFAGEAAPPIELASGSGDAPVDAAVMLPDDDREAAAFWASYFWRRRRRSPRKRWRVVALAAYDTRFLPCDPKPEIVDPRPQIPKLDDPRPQTLNSTPST